MSAYYTEIRPAYTDETDYPVTITLDGSGSIVSWSFSAAMAAPSGSAATGTPTAAVLDAVARTVLLTLPGQATAGVYRWAVRRTDDGSDDVVAHGLIEVSAP